MKIVLIGGNPKGFKKPFDIRTLSGKRLRSILREIKLDCEIIDMTKNLNDIPTKDELNKLYLNYKEYDKIVFLGRFVEKELKKYLPNGFYLPHPASRRKKDLNKLRDGLLSIKEELENVMFRLQG